MAQERLDFSTQLSPGNDPISPNGGLLVQAGQERGQAAIVGAKATSDLFKQGAGMAIDAAHGYLESEQEAAIKKTTEQLMASNKFRDTVDILNSPTSTPDDLKKAQQDLENSKAALDQGLITRDQALLQIDKKVKEYSNVLPGYAAELRKQAATLTGVPHMGYYAEYAALTKASMGEKLAEHRALAALKETEHLRTGFITENKRIPTESDLKVWAAIGALEVHAKQLKIQAEIRGATVAQIEPTIQDLVSNRLGQGVLKISTMISGLAGGKDEKGNLIPPTNLAIARGQILSLIDREFAGLQAEVNSFNSNQLSSQTKETILNRLNTQHKDLVTSLTNSDSFDAFKKIMSIQGEQAKNIFDRFAIASPASYIMTRTGLAPNTAFELFTDARRNPQRYEVYKKNNPELAQVFESILTFGSQEGQNLADNSAKISRDPGHLDAVRATNPAQGVLQMHILKDSIEKVSKEGWGTDPQTKENRMTNFANWITAFSNQVRVGSPDIIREWTKLVSNPNLITRISELPKQVQNEVVAPIFNRTREILESQDVPENGLFAQLGRIIKDQSEQLLLATEFRVVVNPTTQLFEVQSKSKARTKGAVDITPEGAGSVAYNISDKWTTRTGSNLGAIGLKEVLDNINRSIQTLKNLGSIGYGPSDETIKEGLSTNLLNKFNAGYFDLSGPERNKALGKENPLTTNQLPKSSDLLTPSIESNNQRNVESILKEMERSDMTPSKMRILTKELKNLLSNGGK